MLELRKRAHAGDGKQLILRLQHLYHVLKLTSESLSPKLAEYAYFPLAQLLSARHLIPVQGAELSLQCLVILIAHGWQSYIPPKLCSQLVTTFTFWADASEERQKGTQPSDELRNYAFVCMKTLFTAIRTNYATRSALVAFDHVPQLGHAITVLLEGISTADSSATQLEAAHALGCLFACLDDHDVLANFLPGVVSTLTKVLTPSTQSRRIWKLLVACVDILTDLLRRTVSDIYTIAIRQTDRTSSEGDDSKILVDKAGTKKRHGAGWLKASAGQIRLALANINRLYSHDREEVRNAVFNLNYMILVDCGESMPNCRQFALEAGISIAEISESDESQQNLRSRITMATQTQPELADLLQSSFRDWSISMDRVMAGADDRVKERRLQQVFSGFSMIYDGSVTSASSVRLMASLLLDSVVTLIKIPPSKSTDVVRDLGLLSLRGEQGISNAISRSVRQFNGRVAHSTSQQAVLDIIKSRIGALPSGASTVALANSLLDILPEHDRERQIATYWLLVSILQGTNSENTDEFLIIDDAPSHELDSILNEVYSRSLVVVAEEDADWRLHALSLEALALQAQRSGLDFQGELIDALYPVLFLLGSSVPQVSDNAVICLDIVASSCGYTDVKDLIVSNVDYLVNAVALKLNAFDISPQAPQVLLMMVRLAGPSLLPYLEDTIETIFAALEDYHGYPLLVELLFAVLKAMAEEGVKAPHLAIEAPARQEERFAHDWTPISVSGLAAKLRQREDPDGPDEIPDESDDQDTGPASPHVKSRNPNDDQALDLANLNPDGEIPTDIPADPPAKLSKSYTLVHKITELTQHYLSSSSPSLRTSLLALIKTTIPALAAGDEDTYLPLVNTLWPELVSRLADDEPGVVSAALDVLGVMCEFAGDFMRSRVRDLWEDVRRLVKRIGTRDGPAGLRHGRGHGQNQDQPQRHRQAHSLVLGSQEVAYVDASKRTLVANTSRFLVTVVKHVGIESELFEEVLGWLSPLSKLDERDLQVLREENGDTVWLALWKEGVGRGITTPRPRGDGDWTFVPVAV